MGTVYTQGNLLFNPEGTHLFSPVGNKVTVFDLVEYGYQGRHSHLLSDTFLQ